MKNTELTNWKPCYADSQRGVSFFDGSTVEGIKIEADSISDPRWDRVLPILEEEQIFMCRQMEDKLQSGQLVLDVGTGSGVFAIFAAKMGCRVVALDISARALRFAYDNAIKNGVRVQETTDSKLTDFSQLENGSIQLVKMRFEEFAKLQSNAERFDVVFLAPPYNPTCPGVFPALHAEAGLDGQKLFDEQIKIAPNVLRVGGLCIGNQMSISSDTTKIVALETIGKFFVSYRVHYAHILDDEPFIAAGDFLEEQYASFLLEPELDPDEDIESKEQNSRLKAVKNYIDTIGPGREFSLIYYEIEKLAEQFAIVEEFEPTSRPAKTWSDRTCLHRRIVDHTSSINSFPAPALFMERDAISSLPPAESVTDQKMVWKNSTLRPVNRWLQTSGTLCGTCTEPPLFDVLFVDTAPFYRSVEGIENLPEECKIWLSDAAQQRLISADQTIKGAQEKLIYSWQLNSKILQLSKIGPFLHPHFTGKNAPREWRGIQSSHFENGEVIAVHDEEKQVFDNLLELYEQESPYGHKRTEKLQQITEEIREDWHLEGEHGYGSSLLKNLGIAQESEFLKKYEEQMNDLLALYSHDFGEFIASEQQVQQKAIARHLELSHLVMHQGLREHFESLDTLDLKWSTLIGLPFSLAFENETKEGVPKNYRGGLWIYVGSSRAWTTQHEAVLFDLLKLLWVLYEGKYSYGAAHKAGERGEISGAKDTMSWIGHEASSQLSSASKFVEQLSEDAAQSKMQLEYDPEGYANIVLSSLQYAQLFIANNTDGNTDWLPKENEKVNSWLERCFTIAWRVAVARECRKISRKYELFEAADILLSAPPHINSFCSSNLRYSFSLDKEKTVKIVQFTLAALSNAIRWSGPETGNKFDFSLLRQWRAKPNFQPISVVVENRGEASFIGIYNGVSSSSASSQHASEKKDGGTRGVLEALMSWEQYDSPVVFERSGQEDRKAVKLYLGKETKAWKTTVTIPEKIFVER